MPKRSDLLCCRVAELPYDSSWPAERAIDCSLYVETRTEVFDLQARRLVEEILPLAGMERRETVPLLDSHQRGSIAHVLGSLRDIDAAGDRLTGRLFFSDAGLGGRAWRLVDDAHVNDLSVACIPLESVLIQPGDSANIDGRTYEAGELPLIVRKRWWLMETSLVVCGVDPNATVLRLDQSQGVATFQTTGQVLRVYLTREEVDRMKGDIGPAEELVWLGVEHRAASHPVERWLRESIELVSPVA